eukprot:4086946-Pleurochrysis_carterae.AAC.1
MRERGSPAPTRELRACMCAYLAITLSRLDDLENACAAYEKARDSPRDSIWIARMAELCLRPGWVARNCQPRRSFLAQANLPRFLPAGRAENRPGSLSCRRGSYAQAIDMEEDHMFELNYAIT